MRIDIVDVVADENGVEPMASFAMTDLAQRGRTYVMNLETDTWQSLIGRVQNRSNGPGSIDILQVHSHGTPGTMFAGRLNENNATALEGVFSALAPYFAPGGQVYLKGCTTGQRPGLLQPLARAFNVPVTAGVQVQWVAGGLTDVYIGRTVTATPDGMMHIDRDGIPRQATP